MCMYGQLPLCWAPAWQLPLCESDSCQMQCYCIMQVAYQRDAPQPPCCCCRLLLLCCCSAAQVQLVLLCNHWVRLHSCTLPVLLLKLLLKPLLWLGLAWVEEFKLSLSLELASLGYLGLGTLNKYFHGKLNQLSSFAYCSYISPLVWGNSGEKFKEYSHYAISFCLVESIPQFLELWPIPMRVQGISNFTLLYRNATTYGISTLCWGIFTVSGVISVSVSFSNLYGYNED